MYSSTNYTIHAQQMDGWIDGWVHKRINGGFQLKDFLPKDTLPTLSRSNILNAI